MIAHNPPSAAARCFVAGALATLLALSAGNASAQPQSKTPQDKASEDQTTQEVPERTMSAPGGAAVLPPPDPNEVRKSGLYIGKAGFSTGPGGGLDKELIRNNPPPTPDPAPGLGEPSADLRDFSGSWYGDQFLPAFEIMTDMYGAKLPFNEAGRTVADRRLVAMDRGKPLMSPSILCRPSGPDWMLVRISTRFYQSKDRIDVFSTADHSWWSIALDPALLPPAKGKTYMGRSVGHWEGDTLVVENTDFKTRRWLSFRGTPVSPEGKLSYRIRKLHDGGKWYLEIVTTVDDPAYYTRPWRFARSLTWRPDLSLVDEFDCEEQIGSPTGVGDTGTMPETSD
ncbi:hypothetical protein WSK_2316 [Novosphingobium sp. Rr 2-17]|uniref:hypothetical protein n=1 Tax=Novosphingobium sp. Rr 2-17 TaxID=555793 RepID=UPI0002699ED1|nr:hypothetical protein [Novosphingobium sp. Rr 2-17]EIZ79129.1 hypothetical protein WSK_2316 [Novosphingobium sp. Rr 2-17]